MSEWRKNSPIHFLISLFPLFSMFPCFQDSNFNPIHPNILVHHLRYLTFYHSRIWNPLTHPTNHPTSQSTSQAQVVFLLVVFLPWVPKCCIPLFCRPSNTLLTCQCFLTIRLLFYSLVLPYPSTSNPVSESTHSKCVSSAVDGNVYILKISKYLTLSLSVLRVPSASEIQVECSWRRPLI